MEYSGRRTTAVKAMIFIFFAMSVLSGLLSAGVPAHAAGNAAFLPKIYEEKRRAESPSVGLKTDDREETKYLIPCGTPFGVRFYTDGALVSRVEEGSAAERMGITAGDVIVALDGKRIVDAAEWLYAVGKGDKEKSVIEWTRDGHTNKGTLASDGQKGWGIHVKDSLAGIGTLTFIDPQTRRFAGLGHGICRDNGAGLLPLGSGSICGVRITSVLSGAPGAPGQLRGSFCPGQTGRVTENKGQGIFGVYSGEIPRQEPLPAAEKEQVREGKAEILCILPDSSKETYAVRIEKILSFDPSGRNYLLTVIDKELLEKTGGIVQGMSGSPILQDGRIVGAVTHVLVEDPAKGYGIFIGNMLDNM